MIQKDRLDRVLKPLMDKGVGLACLHYAVEVPKGKPGDAFLNWIGGYYESGFSTNPHWVADIKNLPEHEITRGVKPFAVSDEWYFNIRFRPEMKGVTPILVAKPSDATRQGQSASPRGPYAHIAEAKGRDECAVLGRRAPGRRPRLRIHGCSLPQELRQRRFPQAGAERDPLDRPRGGPLRRTPKSSVTDEELKKNLDPKGR